MASIVLALAGLSVAIATLTAYWHPCECSSIQSMCPARTYCNISRGSSPLSFGVRIRKNLPRLQEFAAQRVDIVVTCTFSTAATDSLQFPGPCGMGDHHNSSFSEASSENFPNGRLKNCRKLPWYISWRDTKRRCWYICQTLSKSKG